MFSSYATKLVNNQRVFVRKKCS